MTRLLYDTAEALVYDPVSANRMATRAVLYTLGFRKIETVGTTKAFAEYLRKRPPDLAVCEVQGADVELCGMIQNLRQGGEGYNPFIVIIATAWEKNAALIARVVNSGADDLLLRPFSTALLASRIETTSSAARASSSPPTMSAPTAAATRRGRRMSNCSTRPIRSR